MGKLLPINKRRNKFKRIPANKDVVEALKQLRYEVENQGAAKIKLIGGTYREERLDEVRTAVVPPWEFGYKVEEVSMVLQPGLFRRTLFIKLPGEDILGIPERDREAIMKSVFEAVVDQECEMPAFDLIARDCIRMTQDFLVVFWHESNPNIVTPGKKG